MCMQSLVHCYTMEDINLKVVYLKKGISISAEGRAQLMLLPHNIIFLASVHAEALE